MAEGQDKQEVAFERPPGSSHFNFTMTSLLISGGAFAYYKSRSVPSLAAGVLLGSAFAVSADMIKKGDNTRGHALGLATGATLTGVMGYRFLKTRQLVPTGILAMLGVASTLYNAKKTNEW